MGLEWKEQLSVGNRLIDDDHKRLIELVNSVEAALGRKSLDEMKASLEQLDEYAQYHFDREEKVARAAGYTHVGQLRQAHELLRKELGRSVREFESLQGAWSDASVDKFPRFLRSWFIDHVIKEDLLMKPLLKTLPYEFRQD
jgi:hemerythrin